MLLGFSSNYLMVLGYVQMNKTSKPSILEASLEHFMTSAGDVLKQTQQFLEHIRLVHFGQGILGSIKWSLSLRFRKRFRQKQDQTRRTS